MRLVISEFKCIEKPISKGREDEKLRTGCDLDRDDMDAVISVFRGVTYRQLYGPVCYGDMLHSVSGSGGMEEIKETKITDRNI